MGRVIRPSVGSNKHLSLVLRVWVQVRYAHNLNLNFNVNQGIPLEMLYTSVREQSNHIEYHYNYWLSANHHEPGREETPVMGKQKFLALETLYL